MIVKFIFLFALLSIDTNVAEDVIAVPKKFTRSRYSHRKSTTTTTTELPSSNYDNNVDMVTDVFSEELLPNKVEELITTHNPFDVNATVTTASSTSIDESLNNSTITDLIETTTDKEIELTTEKDVELTMEKIINATDDKEIENVTEQEQQQDIFPCGERSDDNHPWVAVLVHTDPSGRSRKKTLSKGVLIDRRHVLTTVSSLHNSRPFWIVSRVRLGDALVLTGSGTEVNKSMSVNVGIQEIFQHKNRDIALIKLAENVNFTAFVRPICLPSNDQYNFTELYLHMCKKESKYSVTSTITTSPLSPQDCEIMFRRKRAKITADEFCVWDETGDSCTGDLGGPLIAMDDGRYSVIGLNSHINSKVKFNFNDYPGVYVRVGSHLSWIRKVTGLSS